VETARQWRDYFINAANQLHQSRLQAASTLDAAVRAELPPLNLTALSSKLRLPASTRRNGVRAA